MQIQKSKRNFAIHIISIGVLVLVLNFLYYQSFQPLVITDENSIWIQKISYVFYVLLFGGIALIAFGIHKMFQVYDNEIDYYHYLTSSNLLPYSLSKIIIMILHNKRYFRFFWPASIGYGIFYSILSGMLIYHSDNFSSLYGVTTIPSITIIPYGPMGYVPTMVVYITEHIGLLIIPINFFIVLTVSSLVGFNVVLSIYAFVNHPKTSSNTTANTITTNTTTSFLGALGAATSLFAACPTCASVYIFSILSGSLAPTVAAFTATYYIIFIAVSIPLFILTLFLTALSIRNMILFNQCSLDKKKKK